MSGSRKKRKHIEQEYEDAELNIMPFIDVFSVLNTFLLFSAVFVAIGVIKVQVPFFSNAEQKEQPKRTLQVNVDAEKAKITLTSSFTRPPTNDQKFDYGVDDAALEQLHKKLVEIRLQNPDLDLVTFFCQDDVNHEQVVKILDSIKMRREGDPEFPESTDEDEKDRLLSKGFVIPKVVMGSVIL